jgi:hypothetical protein
VILKSQANLAVSRAAGWDDASKAAFGGLLDALNAAPEAKAKFSAFKD